MSKIFTYAIMSLEVSQRHPIGDIVIWWPCENVEKVSATTSRYSHQLILLFVHSPYNVDIFNRSPIPESSNSMTLAKPLTRSGWTVSTICFPLEWTASGSLVLLALEPIFSRTDPWALLGSNRRTLEVLMRPMRLQNSETPSMTSLAENPWHKPSSPLQILKYKKVWAPSLCRP